MLLTDTLPPLASTVKVCPQFTSAVSSKGTSPVGSPMLNGLVVVKLVVLEAVMMGVVTMGSDVGGGVTVGFVTVVVSLDGEGG